MKRIVDDRCRSDAESMGLGCIRTKSCIAAAMKLVCEVSKIVLNDMKPPEDDLLQGRPGSAF